MRKLTPTVSFKFPSRQGRPPPRPPPPPPPVLAGILDRMQVDSKYFLLVDAILKENLDLVDKIISEGCDVNTIRQARIYWCPLVAALDTSGTNMFIHLVNKHKADIKIQHPICSGFTIMSEVVLRCRVDLGIVLLSMGEDINQKIFNRQYVDNGFHILHGLMLLETINDKNFELTKKALQMGANPANQSNWDFELNLGIPGNYGDAFRFLKALQEKFPGKSFDGLVNILNGSEQAQRDQKSYVVEDLRLCNIFRNKLESGSLSNDEAYILLTQLSKNGIATWGFRLLINTISANRTDLICLMVEKDVNINSVEEGLENWCPLVATLKCPGKVMMELLITLGADVNIKYPGNPLRGVFLDAVLAKRFDLIQTLTENGADLNQKIYPNVNGKGGYYILHATILNDVLNSDALIPWTSVFLKMGANPDNKADWESQCDAFQLLVELQKKHPERSFGKLLNLLSKTDKKTEETLSPIKDEEIQADKNDVVAQVDINEHVYDIEDLVKLGDTDKLRNQLDLDPNVVNKRIEKVGGTPLDGPIIVAAIENENLEVLNMLVTEYKANLDEPIIWEKKSSTIIIFAMAKALESNNLTIVERLLSLGCDINNCGWINVRFYQGFGSPLIIAQILDFQIRTELSSDLLEMIAKHYETFWKTSNFESLNKDIFDSMLQVKAQMKTISKNIAIAKSRLADSKDSRTQIKDLRYSTEYLTDEEIRFETRKTQQELTEPRKILAEIKDLEGNPGYLDANQVAILEIQLASASRQYRSPHIECVGCKRIPASLLGNILQVYTCQENHNFCQTCLTKTEFCNVCKQDFKKLPPVRNKPAEDEIELLNAKRKKEEEEEAALMNLPDGVSDELKVIVSMKQKAKAAIARLEVKIDTARKLIECKKRLEELENYKTEGEMDFIQRRSDEKILKARGLQQRIATIKMNPAYLRKNQHKELKNLLESCEGITIF